MGKIDEALSILKALGLPKAQQNERTALTLLALADLKKKTPWSKARSRSIRIHDILVFIQENYGKQYAENTRETIRRQTLHQFEQAAVAVRNPDDPSRPTRHRRSTETWTRSCGTAAKAGGNREHKLRPVVTEGSYLLEHDGTPKITL